MSIRQCSILSRRRQHVNRHLQMTVTRSGTFFQAPTQHDQSDATAAQAHVFHWHDRLTRGDLSCMRNVLQVLRFQCYWDDRLAPYGDVRFFRLYYYLSDDTMEVVEALPRNCGRGPFSHLLRRMPLPKAPGPVGAPPGV